MCEEKKSQIARKISARLCLWLGTTHSLIRVAVDTIGPQKRDRFFFQLLIFHTRKK